MKIFRSIGMALALACGTVLGACSLVVHPILRFVADVCDRAACGIERLDLELAQKFAEKVVLGDKVRSGMRRESHGFRQSSVADTYEAPALG